jgi:hypothetical protein
LIDAARKAGITFSVEQPDLIQGIKPKLHQKEQKVYRPMLPKVKFLLDESFYL